MPFFKFTLSFCPFCSLFRTKFSLFFSFFILTPTVFLTLTSAAFHCGSYFGNLLFSPFHVTIHFTHLHCTLFFWYNVVWGAVCPLNGAYKLGAFDKITAKGGNVVDGLLNEHDGLKTLSKPDASLRDAGFVIREGRAADTLNHNCTGCAAATVLRWAGYDAKANTNIPIEFHKTGQLESCFAREDGSAPMEKEIHAGIGWRKWQDWGKELPEGAYGVMAVNTKRIPEGSAFVTNHNSLGHNHEIAWRKKNSVIEYVDHQPGEHLGLPYSQADLEYYYYGGENPVATRLDDCHIVDVEKLKNYVHF